MSADFGHEPTPTVSITVSRRRLIIGSAGLLLVIALGIGGYLYSQRGSDGQQEVRKYQAEIGRVAVLPDKETPALGTVTDPAKLGHQKFFKDAKPGDKTLIYSENNVVVLYRPSEKKIVNMGPVEISPLDPSPSPSATAE